MKSNKMEIGKIYTVIRESNDSTVRIGDRVAIANDGKLYKGLSLDRSVAGWINQEDLTSEIMSFEVELP